MLLFVVLALDVNDLDVEVAVVIACARGPIVALLLVNVQLLVVLLLLVEVVLLHLLAHFLL